MIRIQLTDIEAQRLERAFRQATDCKLLDRLQIDRLAHRGRKHEDFADASEDAWNRVLKFISANARD